MTAQRAVPIPLLTLLFAAATVMQTVPTLAQTASTASQAVPTSAQKDRNTRKARAIENCKANRGVDCVTPQGLQEWELLERSRAQALREGARRNLPPPAQGTR